MIVRILVAPRDLISTQASDGRIPIDGIWACIFIFENIDIVHVIWLEMLPSGGVQFTFTTSIRSNDH